MTHLVISTDASVLPDGAAGVGYVVERVRDDGEQDEMLVKECDHVSIDCSGEHSRTVKRAEHAAVVHGVEAAFSHYNLSDEKLVIRCDNRDVVRYVRDGRDFGGGRSTRLERILDEAVWEIREIPRELNSLADSLSKQASRGKMR